jgi:hypothetical protein
MDTGFLSWECEPVTSCSVQYKNRWIYASAPLHEGASCSVVVETLFYKPERRGFEFRLSV